MEQCSFCGKKINAVSRMIKAPNREDVYICDSCINICESIMNSNGMKMESQPSTKNVSGIDGLTPAQIHNELNKFIIGQEHAKKVLSVAIYNHNKRLNDKTGLIKKSNILIAGPSGCGKTLLARTLANMLDVPFVVADATSLTEAGYVGDDVEVCLQRLIEVADGDIEKAQQGIVYIDEIDKIARAGENRSITRDVSGEGVQASLLKLIEGCEVSVPINGRRKIPGSQNNVMFNTHNVLFICGGAFEGLFDKTKKNEAIGFSTGNPNEVIDEDKEVNEKLTQKALVKFGMMPELVGRLPVLCALTELKEDDLVRILTEPEDAITKEYQALFRQDGIELIYEEDALRKIASIAIKKGTGARGLRTILEDVMLDVMYDVPNEINVSQCIVTADSIDTKKVEIRKIS
jgi:ATP-dependent Clp protease ATP-binding subunit ClpX